MEDNREQLRISIDDLDFKTAICTAKKLGYSLRYICKKAEINVGNTSAWLNGSLGSFTISQQNKLLTALESLITD